jgi:hypothetical protein
VQFALGFAFVIGWAVGAGIEAICEGGRAARIA